VLGRGLDGALSARTVVVIGVAFSVGFETVLAYVYYPPAPSLLRGDCDAARTVLRYVEQGHLQFRKALGDGSHRPTWCDAHSRDRGRGFGTMTPPRFTATPAHPAMTWGLSPFILRRLGPWSVRGLIR
jgi:hypothetical protein